jgi:hypothetical protein
MDPLIEKYLVTIPVDERLPILANMIHHMTEHLVTIGIFFLVEPVAIGNRLVNVPTVRGENGVLTWSAHEWGVMEP